MFMKQEKMSEFQNDLVSSYQTIDEFFEFIKEEKLNHLRFSGYMFSSNKLMDVDISELKLKGYYQLSKESLETSCSKLVYNTIMSILGLEHNEDYETEFMIGYNSVLISVNFSYEHKIFKIEDVYDYDTWEKYYKWVLDKSILSF